jgi:hypothetical protein
MGVPVVVPVMVAFPIPFVFTVLIGVGVTVEPGEEALSGRLTGVRVSRK